MEGILTSDPIYEVKTQVEYDYKVARPKEFIKIVDLSVADLTSDFFVSYV